VELRFAFSLAALACRPPGRRSPGRRRRQLHRPDAADRRRLRKSHWPQGAARLWRDGQVLRPDQERRTLRSCGRRRNAPTKLARGAAVAASQFTYAKGKLALWSAKDAIVDDKGEVLKQAGFDHIALANPKLAPYGAAAVEAMKALGVHDSLAPKFVTAENIGQTFQFVKSGNALLGFVALSQVTRDNKLTEGSAWVLPANLYQPIKQDAIVLDKGKGKPAAEALMKFLRGDQARAVIRAYGYDL
jgi:molybdenum ABC transporter molybdate-binding protein